MKIKLDITFADALLVEDARREFAKGFGECLERSNGGTGRYDVERWRLQACEQIQRNQNKIVKKKLILPPLK